MHLHKEDQKNAIVAIPILTSKEMEYCVNAMIRAAMFIGNTQYPKTQTLWKNDTFPPNSLALTLILNYK